MKLRLGRKKKDKSREDEHTGERDYKAEQSGSHSNTKSMLEAQRMNRGYGSGAPSHYTNKKEKK